MIGLHSKKNWKWRWIEKQKHINNEQIFQNKTTQKYRGCSWFILQGYGHQPNQAHGLLPLHWLHHLAGWVTDNWRLPKNNQIGAYTSNITKGTYLWNIPSFIMSLSALIRDGRCWFWISLLCVQAIGIL